MINKTINLADYESAEEALRGLLDIGMPMLKSPPIAARLTFAFALGAMSYKTYKIGNVNNKEIFDDLMAYLEAASDDEIAALVADVKEDE